MRSSQLSTRVQIIDIQREASSRLRLDKPGEAHGVASVAAVGRQALVLLLLTRWFITEYASAYL